MAIHQFWIDDRERELRQQLLEELAHYHRLRRCWGLGPLKLKHRQGGRQGSIEIWANYFDLEVHRTHQAFLGSGKGQSGWKQALQRVNHVKSFL